MRLTALLATMASCSEDGQVVDQHARGETTSVSRGGGGDDGPRCDAARCLALEGQLADAQATNAVIKRELEETAKQLEVERQTVRSLQGKPGRDSGEQTPSAAIVQPSSMPAAPADAETAPAAAPVAWTKSVFPRPDKKFAVTTGSGQAAVHVTALEWKKRRWISDRYDTSWHYTEPDKGNFYVTMDFSVTTVLHDPQLPAFYVVGLGPSGPVAVGDGSPATIGFYKWDDYGSYLGNYADYGNDFSKSESVRFTAMVEIPQSAHDGPLLLLATRQGCAPRQQERFQNPAVRYVTSRCGAFRLLDGEMSSPASLWSRFHLLAIHNEAKIPK